VTGAQAGIGINTGVGEDVLSVTFAGLDVGAATGIAQGTGATTALGPLAYSFTGPDQLTLDGETFTVTGGDQTLEFADGRTLSLNLTLPIAPATGTITAQANLSIDGGQNVVTTDFTSSTVQLVDAEGRHESSTSTSRTCAARARTASSTRARSTSSRR
jgi:hypothetical protein